MGYDVATVVARSALVVGLDADAFRRVRSVLRRCGLTINRVELARDGVRSMADAPFHLVVCRYPLPDMVTREFVDAIWRNGGRCTNASLLVLAIPDMCAEASRAIRGGPFQVQSVLAKGPILHGAVDHLLRISARRQAEIDTRIEVHEGQSYDARIVDLSLTGMLVESVPLLPIRTRCSFEFALPRLKEIVSGTAEVVRHSQPEIDHALGVGFRFLSLDPPCRERLDDELSE